jgi:hypothetical protein
MKTTLTNPKSAAATGLLLALPFTTLFLAFMLGLDPSLGLFPRLFNVDESCFVSFIVFGALLLLLAAFIITLAVIVRDVRARNGLSAHPVNLILAIASLTMISLFVGGIVVDQYPCWIGVPNCD